MREAEHRRKIIDYLKKNLKKGYDTESLKWALVKQGYSRTLVDHAIREANAEIAKETPVAKEKPVITHEIVTDEPPVQKSWLKRFFGLE